jgi:hypothetical protein
MRVIYYHRYARSGFHIHAYSSADIFYVPDENLILFREQHGSFGGRDYSFTDRPELLDEATTVMQGSKVEGIEISDVREFEYDKTKIKELIREVKLKAELETKVRSGIEELLTGPNLGT